MTTFGTKIHDARRKKRLTLAEVGTLVGLPESSVQRYEKGIYPNPTRSLILRFSRTLSVPLDELMGWNDADPDADIHLLSRSINTPGTSMSPKTQQILRFILDDNDEEDTLCPVFNPALTARYAWLLPFCRSTKCATCR